MHISSFKKGDIITRTEPSAAIFGDNNLLGIDCIGSRSYMGDRLKFLGIANNQIYFQFTEGVDLKVLGDKPRKLPLDAYSEGWDFYVDPKTLLEENSEVNILNKNQLLSALEKALETEDYERAEEIKKQLEQFNNNKN